MRNGFNSFLYLVVGAVEWALAIIRIRACVRGQAILASSLVLVETMLGLWVFRQYADGNDLAGLCYALGGAIGTYLFVKNPLCKSNFVKYLRKPHYEFDRRYFKII